MQPSFAHSVCNAHPHPVRHCSPLSSPSCTHCFAYSMAFNVYGDNQIRANKAPKILYCCQFFRPSSVLSLFNRGEINLFVLPYLVIHLIMYKVTTKWWVNAKYFLEVRTQWGSAQKNRQRWMLPLLSAVMQLCSSFQRSTGEIKLALQCWRKGSQLDDAEVGHGQWLQRCTIINKGHKVECLKQGWEFTWNLYRWKRIDLRKGSSGSCWAWGRAGDRWSWKSSWKPCPGGPEGTELHI